MNDAAHGQHRGEVRTELERDLGMDRRRAPIGQRDAFVQAPVDVALPDHLQVAGRKLEGERSCLPPIPDGLRLDPVHEQSKLREQARVAQPQPVSVRARRGHGAARGGYCEAPVLLEDGALARQVLRAWAGAECGCAASKAGLVPIAYEVASPRASRSTAIASRSRTRWLALIASRIERMPTAGWRFSITWRSMFRCALSGTPGSRILRTAARTVACVPSIASPRPKSNL